LKKAAAQARDAKHDFPADAASGGDSIISNRLGFDVAKMLQRLKFPFGEPVAPLVAGAVYLNVAEASVGTPIGDG
jgi:hypothetical protein